MKTVLDRELSPSAKYIDKAERYLEEAKEVKPNNPENWQWAQAHKQTLILGSIAASLIALSKK